MCIYVGLLCACVFVCADWKKRGTFFGWGGSYSLPRGNFPEGVFLRGNFPGGGDFPRIILKNIIILPNCTLCFLVAHCFSDNNSGNKRKCYSMFWKQTKMLLYVMKM